MKIKYLFFTMFVFLLLSGCSKQTEVDLTDYAKVTFSGLNGSGQALLEFDNIKFEESLLDGEVKDVMKVAQLEDSIEYSLDKNESLSNGDTIVVTVSWNDKIAKENNFKFKVKNKEIVVKDLKEPTHIDLFQDVYIEYSEVSPSAKAIVRNASSDSFLKKVKYNIDNTSNLANGDIITVKAEYNKELAEKEGYVIDEIEKKYTVSGVDEYISSYDKIDKASLLEMDKHARDIIESKLADWNYSAFLYPGQAVVGISQDSLEIINIELKNSYFFVLKKGIEKTYLIDVDNSLFLVYEVQFRTNKTVNEYDIVYLPVYFKDIVLRDDGKIDIKITEAKITEAKSNNFDNLYRDIVTVNKAKYDFEEISSN